MATNYDLTNTGAEVQERLNTVPDNVDRLDGIDESIEALQEGKADNATTLEGYGIEDAYTKGEVDNLIQGVTEDENIVVDTLPASGETNKVYRVPGSGYYTDYMWVNGAWKQISQYQMSFDQTQVGYFTCDTAAATAAKVVDATGYALATGGNMRIKMTYTNTADAVTLNINSTGAKALFYDGVQVSASNTWKENEVIVVYYDGTQYQASNARGGGGKFATGELVKNVDIVNNLEDGGPGNILSAEQGKELGEDFKNTFRQSPIDLSMSVYVAGYTLRGGSTWQYDASSYHNKIPRNPSFTKLYVKANSDRVTYVYFFRSYTQPTSTSDIPDICGDYPNGVSINAGKACILEIPTDCQWVVYDCRYSGVFFEPDSISYAETATQGFSAVSGEMESLENGMISYEESIADNLTWIIGKACQYNGEITDNNSWSYFEYFDVSSYAKVKLSGRWGGSFGATFYDENYILIGKDTAGAEETRTGFIQNIPYGTKYMRFSVKTNEPVATNAVFLTENTLTTLVVKHELDEFKDDYNEDSTVRQPAVALDNGTITLGRLSISDSITAATAWCYTSYIDISLYKKLMVSGYFGVNYGINYYNENEVLIGYYTNETERAVDELVIDIIDGAKYIRFCNKSSTIQAGALKGIPYVIKTHQDIYDDMARIESIIVNAGYVYLAGNYNVLPSNSDNTASLQALIDEINIRGGGVIELNYGTYDFKGSVRMRSNVGLKGQGIGNTILNMVDNETSSAGWSLFTGDHIQNIFMKDFEIQSPSTTSTGKHLFMRYIEDSYFTHLKSVGSLPTAIGIDFLNHVFITDNIVINAGRGGNVFGNACIGIGTGYDEWDNEDFVISNNICINGGMRGIFVEDQNRFTTGTPKMRAGYGQVISGNLIRNSRTGVSVELGRYVNVTGNTIYNCTNGLLIRGWADHCLFNGNLLINNTNGISVTNLENVTSEDIAFIGNTINGGNNAITIDSGGLLSEVFIKNNVMNKSINGCSVNGDMSHLVIQGNNDFSTTKSFDLTGTFTDSIIKDNTYFIEPAGTPTFSGSTTWVEQFN